MVEKAQVCKLKRCIMYQVDSIFCIYAFRFIICCNLIASMFLDILEDRNQRFTSLN